MFVRCERLPLPRPPGRRLRLRPRVRRSLPDQGPTAFVRPMRARDVLARASAGGRPAAGSQAHAPRRQVATRAQVQGPRLALAPAHPARHQLGRQPAAPLVRPPALLAPRARQLHLRAGRRPGQGARVLHERAPRMPPRARLQEPSARQHDLRPLRMRVAPARLDPRRTREQLWLLPPVAAYRRPARVQRQGLDDARHPAADRLPPGRRLPMRKRACDCLVVAVVAGGSGPSFLAAGRC